MYTIMQCFEMRMVEVRQQRHCGVLSCSCSSMLRYRALFTFALKGGPEDPEQHLQLQACVGKLEV